MAQWSWVSLAMLATQVQFLLGSPGLKIFLHCFTLWKKSHCRTQSILKNLSSCRTCSHSEETKQQKTSFSSYFCSEFKVWEETFTVNRETPFLHLWSVFELNEVGISLLIRVSEMWLEWLRFNCKKKFLRPQQSLDQLKNAGKPRKGVSPSTV